MAEYCDKFRFVDTDNDSFEFWNGLRGPQGIQGEAGPIGPQGIQGPVGPIGPVGPQGPIGEPFTYDDFTPEQLEALTGPQGSEGPPGPAVEFKGPVESTGDLPATAPSGEVWLVGDNSPFEGWFYNGEEWRCLGVIDLGSELGIYYGVCSDVANASARAVSIPGITALKIGLSIRVRFTTAYTGNGTITLNLNGLGALAVTTANSGAVGSYQWAAGAVVDFVYNGNNWILVNGGHATTLQWGVTKLLSSSESTNDSYSLTPSALNAFANGEIAPLYSNTTYAVGDRVRYNDTLYECTTAILYPEAWTAGHWTALEPLAKQTKTLKTDVDSKYTKPPTGIPGSDIAEGVIPTVPSAYTSNPAMDGTASPGTSTSWARGNHVHPTDTSRVAKAGDTMTGHLTLQSSITDGTVPDDNIIGTRINMTNSNGSMNIARIAPAQFNGDNNGMQGLQIIASRLGVNHTFGIYVDRYGNRVVITNAAGAWRSALELGDAATDNVVTVPHGGTGATTAANARTNLEIAARSAKYSIPNTEYANIPIANYERGIIITTNANQSAKDIIIYSSTSGGNVTFMSVLNASAAPVTVPENSTNTIRITNNSGAGLSVLKQYWEA